MTSSDIEDQEVASLPKGGGEAEAEPEVEDVEATETDDPNPNLGSAAQTATQLSLSPSERATLEHPVSLPCWISWMERPFRVKSVQNGVVLPEATGWAMDAAARGPLNMVGSYVGVALIALASVDAGCTQLNNCDKTIYGLRPSSMVTVVTAVVGVAAALLMPICGAVVDHTPHRRLIGGLTAAILVIITGIQISISQSNWFLILILEAVGGFTLLVHVAAVFSYLPDLATQQEDYVHYTASFNIRQYCTQTLFAGSVVLISFLSTVKGDPVGNAVRTSRAASALAFGMSFLLLVYAWGLKFRPRPALRSTDQSLWTVGFTSVYKTSKEVFFVKKYKALRWLMIAMLWSPETGAGVVGSIAVTYLQVFLQLKAIPIAITLLLLLFFHLPGSVLSKIVSNRWNPLHSYRMALTCFTISSAVAVPILHGPTVPVVLVYCVASTWGICLGWIYPSQRVLFCTLIPRGSGREFEFMGLFTFFGHILSWLPPVLFIILNENQVSMQWGLALLPMFFGLAVVCTLFMGTFQDAVLAVDPTNEYYQGVGSSRASSGEKVSSGQSDLNNPRDYPHLTLQLDEYGVSHQGDEEQ